MFEHLFPQKPIFTVELIPATTVHSLDPYVDSFLNMTASLQLGGGWSTATSTNSEVELIRAIQVLSLTFDRRSLPKGNKASAALLLLLSSSIGWENYSL